MGTYLSYDWVADVKKKRKRIHRTLTTQGAGPREPYTLSGFNVVVLEDFQLIRDIVGLVLEHLDLFLIGLELMEI